MVERYSSKIGAILSWVYRHPALIGLRYLYDEIVVVIVGDLLHYVMSDIRSTFVLNFELQK